MPPAIVFDRVWKKFRRGERHDSLRDLLPATARRLFARRQASELDAEEFWALEDVSFEVGPGEALGIIGANGAGKSTALKLLTKILKPTLGTCRVRGRVGALIEIAAGFHPDLTGRENIYLQGAILGMKRAEIGRQLDAIVEFSGIGDFIDTPVKRYSSGMNARLGFSIAAHVNPEVLLIDEVLAVGDLAFQQRCFERLAAFRDNGVAVAIVSHNMQAIASICSSAVLLRRNLPPVVGPVSEVLGAYTGAGIEHHDKRIALRRVTLGRRDDPAESSRVFDPGDSVVLRLEFEVQEDFPRLTLQLHVARSDGLLVFDGVSFRAGCEPIDARRGATIVAVAEFKANVLGGTYLIGVNLVDHERRWPVVPIPAVASFVVKDNSHWGGCAYLNPSYELLVSSQVEAIPV